MDELPKFQQVQYRFAAHIRDPKKVKKPNNIEDRRMAIYRDLFYNNVEGFLSRSFPVLRKIYSDTAWHQMAREFFASHRSHSPYFLEIPKEFLDFLQSERDNPRDPPFLNELAHYEWAELALSIDEADVNAIKVDRQGPVMNAVPVLSPTAWSLAYTFPVHQIKPGFEPKQPNEVPTFIIVYRDRQNKVGFIEINPLTARLFELLQSNESDTGRQLLGSLATEINHPNPDVVITGGEQILNNLSAHNIVLGTLS